MVWGGVRGGAPIGEPKRFKGAAFPDCAGTGGAAMEDGGATAENDAEDAIAHRDEKGGGNGSATDADTAGFYRSHCEGTE